MPTTFTRFRRRTNLRLAAAALFAILSGCSWQQAYLTAQGWQRNQCYRLPDETERTRCLAGTSMSYDDYRSQTETRKKE